MNYGSYPDNSITFPTGGRSSQSGAQRPRSGQNGQRRTSGGNQRNRRPASGQNRNAQRRPQNAQNRSGQRMRPVQGQNARRDPVRREGRKKRKLTRAAIRRRRLMRRLTALVMLLCVIGAGVYLTVTMLFKISSIQVQTADGVVQEAGGYTSEQILQALDVHLEENIFSFDPGSKAAALEKVFPMLEDIRVERDYPGTVVVRVTEARPAWAMQTSSGWLTLSGGLKILEEDSAQPAGLPTLYGGEPVSAEPGEQLTFAAEPKADSTPDSAADSSASGTVEEEADQRLESLNTLLAALDGRSRIKGLFWLRDGTSDRVSLEIKDVVAAALKGGTDSVVLCHNHPNGVALPSREDLMATENIVRALGLVKVHLRDHIILTESEYFSMREANRLPFYDFQTGEMLRPY